MKSKKTEPKAKVKIKSLRLHKETLKDLPVKDANAVKGGLWTYGCGAGQCWVARAVYGKDNPRWMLFRDWLMADAPAWFRSLYLRHGERFAKWLAPHAVLKSVIRCWMDSRIEQKFIALSHPI